MRFHLPAALLAFLLIVGCFFIINTSSALPERVASHFDSAGVANGYMTRDGYRLFMLASGVGFPLLVVVLISWLPRLMPNLTNIPNRAYWLAPERREMAFAILSTYALWLGCLLTILLNSVHWLVIRANAVNPPRLENAPFLVLLGVFIGAFAVWILMLLRQFRKTP